MSDNKSSKDETVTEIEKLFRESFQAFVDARLMLDKASLFLKQARRLMCTKNAYDAIMNDKGGDDFLTTERLLAEIESGSILWRSFMLETERQQIPKETRDKLIEFYIKDFH